MIIELQLGADVFLRSFRNAVLGRFKEVCFDQALPIDFGSCGGQEVYLDGIRLPDETTLRRDGTSISVVQPAQARFVTPAALENAGVNQPTACWAPAGNLVFGLFTQLMEDGPALCVSAPLLEPGPQMTQAQAIALGSQLTLLVESTCTILQPPGLDFAELRAVRVEFGANEALSRVAFCVDLVDDEHPEIAAFSLPEFNDEHWNQFLEGHIKPNPQNGEWSFYISGRLLRRSVRAMVAGAIQSAEDDGDISLIRGPYTLYVPAATGVPHVQATFAAEDIDTCLCFWDQIDVDFDATLDIRFGVPENNTLRLHLAVDVTPNAAELVCCGITAALFWPPIGSTMFQEGQLSGEMFAGFFFMTLFARILAMAIGFPILADDAAEGNLELTDDWEKIDDKHYRMDMELDLGSNPMTGQLTLHGIISSGTGAVLSGTHGLVSAREQPPLNLDISENPFQWDWEDKCAENPRLMAEASVNLFGISVGQLEICHAEVLDDPEDQFGPHLEIGTTHVRVRLFTLQVKSAYKAAPYPCKIIIFTAAGVRMVTLPALTILSPTEIITRRNQLMAVQEIVCTDVWKHANQFWKGLRYNPVWSVDPGPQEVGRLWQVAAEGLAAGEQVAVATADGRSLGAAMVNDRGAFHFSALAPDLSLTREFGDATVARMAETRIADPRADAAPAAVVPRAGQVARGTQARGRRLTIRQVALTQVPALREKEPILSVRLTDFEDRPAIAVQTAGALTLYRLAGSSRIFPVKRYTGVGGSAILRDRVLTWDEDRLRPLDRVPGAEPLRRFSGGIRDTIAVRDRVYVLSAEGISVLDSKLREVSRIAAPDASRLAAGRSVIAIAAPDKVSFLDARLGTLLASIALAGVRSVHSADFAFGRDSFLVETTEWHVLKVSGGRVHQAARLPQRPWFQDALRIKRTLVTVSADRRRLMLSSIAGTAIHNI